MSDRIERERECQGWQRHRVNARRSGYDVRSDPVLAFVGSIGDHETGQDEENRNCFRTIGTELPEQSPVSRSADA